MKVSRLTSLRRSSRGNGEVGDPAAVAGQPQKRVALIHRLPDTPGSPVGIGFHGGDHRTEILGSKFAGRRSVHLLGDRHGDEAQSGKGL
jgi:hypothetical protein